MDQRDLAAGGGLDRLRVYARNGRGSPSGHPRRLLRIIRPRLARPRRLATHLIRSPILIIDHQKGSDRREAFQILADKRMPSFGPIFVRSGGFH